MVGGSIRHWPKIVVHFLFPDVCMLCGSLLWQGDNCSEETKGLLICSQCLCRIVPRHEDERIFPCLSDPYGGDPIPDFAVWALLHYEMPVTVLLRNLKFHSWRYAGKPVPAETKMFADEKAGAYYIDAVSWAAEKGITTGLNDGTDRFGIRMDCIRAMAVTFLNRYSKTQ